MNVEFLSTAKTELQNVIDYYNEKVKVWGMSLLRK